MSVVLASLPAPHRDQSPLWALIIARRVKSDERRARRAAGYNLSVARLPLASDTSPEIERLQIERWRAMSAADKAALVSGLTAASYELAMAGVRRRHPDASPREHFLRWQSSLSDAIWPARPTRR